MDWVPLIPRHKTNNDVFPTIREVFQDSISVRSYSLKIPQIFKTNSSQDIQNDCTQEITDPLTKTLLEIEKAEEELIRSHGKALIKINSDLEIIEFIKLKTAHFFEQLSQDYVDKYGLLRKEDVLPQNIMQYIDFTFNPTLHTCTTCVESKIFEQNCEENLSFQDDLDKSTSIIAAQMRVEPMFVLEPEELLFHNCDVNKQYKKKFKLRNVTKQPQTFSFMNFSRNSCLVLEMVTTSRRLAPGMYAEFSVTYLPKSNELKETITFNSINNTKSSLTVLCTRDSPKLRCFVFNPTLIKNDIMKPSPGSKYFSDKRCEALNFTIDCGTCLLGNSSLIMLIIRNDGYKGRFYITTEQDWFFNNCDLKSTQLQQNCFSIFPIYFEIDSGATCEIFILFQPKTAEFYNEKFILLCDNNSSQEIEIVGDCVTFEASLLKIELLLLPSCSNYDEKRVSITGYYTEKSSIIITVTNNSGLYFDYYWSVRSKEDGSKDKKVIPSEWIHILNITNSIPSYSSTDFVIQIFPDNQEEGAYYSDLSLHLKNIPIKSISDYDICACGLKSNDDNSDSSSSSSLDTKVEVIDIELCKLELEFILKWPEASINSNISEKIEDKRKIKQKIKFLQNFINFGILYKNIEVCKSVKIEALTSESIDWKIVEIRLKESLKLALNTNIEHITNVAGKMTKKGQQRKIKYSVKAEEPVRWISALLLLSKPQNVEELTLESICIITYDVSEIKIGLHNDKTNSPALYPGELLYAGIQSHHNIHIHNFGSLTGCFYFLKPIGKDSNKLQVNFEPQSGVINPGVCITVDVFLMPLEEGVIEDFSVPCFTGNRDEMQFLKIACAISGVNLFFYLPSCNYSGYSKVLWPRYSDLNIDWDSYFADRGEDWAPVEAEDRNVKSDDGSMTDSIADLAGWNSIAFTYPTVKIKQVQIRQPQKITIFMENLSPIKTHFIVEASNFGAEYDCVNETLIRTKVINRRDLWEKICNNGYGIVTDPSVPNNNNNIIGYEIVEINIWIYANTWGRYLEEIMVDVDDITPFCFNLYIEVVGLPLEFPFAVNSQLKRPTFRLGTFARNCGIIERNIDVTNVSSIPINITWHIFCCKNEKSKEPFNFVVDLYGYESYEELTSFLSKKYYGTEISEFLDIEPREFWLEKNSNYPFKLTVFPNRFFDDISTFTFNIIGFLHIKESDSFKENYFKRKCETDSPIDLLINGNLEQPLLELENPEDVNIDVFVNSLILKKLEAPQIQLRFRNNYRATILFNIKIEKPFRIKRIDTKYLKKNEQIELHKDESLNVVIDFAISYDEFFQYAEYIYTKNDSRFISVITKDLVLQQQDISPQIFPLELRLHYPHIEVKPAAIEFGSCLLYNTKQTIISLYNLSGCEVKFEIYKTTLNNDFEISPNHGEIPAKTGANKTFIDLKIYFTPREVKYYIETIKILTNIPQYFIDIPINGQGSNNEKFQIVY